MDLLPHNRAAYDAIQEALATSSRTCVIHPTGTGKSYIAMAYIEEHSDEPILFITSYLTTLSRFAADCKRLLGAEVFSHLDLAIYAGLRKGNVYDPESLIDKYQKTTALSGKITETGYKTIILDEFHRVGADTWEQHVKRLLVGRTAIGFSATPIRFLDDNRDMGKEIFYGNVASEITLHDALVDKLLPTPQYITCRYSLWEDLGRALSVDTEDRVQIFDIVNNARELEQGKKFWNGVIRSMQAKGIYYEDAFDVFSRDVEFDSLIMDLDKFRHISSWDFFYALCKQYYQEHGNLEMPYDYTVDKHNLHVWLKAQRQKKQSLSPEQISLLDAIGMVWRKGDEWQIHYEKLKETGLVNLDYIDDTGFPLGHWYYRQRSNYNRGLLSEERIRLLEELGVSWSAKKRDEETGATARWMQWYALCEQYVREHGDFRISGSFVLPDGTRLGKWVKRTRYEKHKLNEKQIELLDRIGMVWAVRTPRRRER